MAENETARPARGCRPGEETSEDTRSDPQRSGEHRLSDEDLAGLLKLDTAMRRALRDVVPPPRKLEDLRTEVAGARIEQRRRRALAELERVWS